MDLLRRLRVLAIPFLYACACLQFVRFYVRNATFYLKLPAYLSGHERLPFQERILPIFILRPMLHSSAVMRLLVHDKGVATGIDGPFYVLSLVSLVTAAILTQLLYRKVSQRQTLAALVFPLFLFCVIWTYTIHNEANFSYPYDMLSLAFFTGGLYAIYQRWFAVLTLILLVGTFNRETTLFLIGIYIVDAASRGAVDVTVDGAVDGAVGGKADGMATADAGLGWQARHGQNFRQVRWARVALLLGIWLAIKAGLSYYFRHNDNSENFVRLSYNTLRLKIRLMPALLNLCGYLLPIALLYWSRIRPMRFGNYILILAVWLPIMFYTGVLLETRIYGELCSWTAIALTLLAEERESTLPLQQGALTQVRAGS